MISFKVNDMTCGHCASTISKALVSVDSQIKFSIDRAQQRVMIEAPESDADALRNTIARVGFTPVLEASQP